MIANRTSSASRRITNALFVSQSLFAASTIAMFTLTPIIAATLGGGEELAGIPSTFTLLGRAMVAYPIGWLMDRFGRRNGLGLGYAMGTLGTVIAVFSIIAGSFPGFLFGSLLLGAARGSAEQSRYVAAEVQPVARQAKAMGLIVFAGTVGAIGGPLLVSPSTHLATTLGLPPESGVFISSVVMLTLALLITFIMLRPDPLQISRAMAADEKKARNEPDAPVGSAPYAPPAPALPQPLHLACLRRPHHRPIGNDPAHGYHPAAHEP
jgi:MFS family permease